MSARRRGSRASDRVVGGLHPVRELLRAHAPLHRILLAESRDASPVVDEIHRLAAEAGLRLDVVPRTDLDERAEGLVHQGVLAVGPPFAYAELDAVLEGVGDEPELLVALDGVTDPHNLGSIARTAEAVGAHALLLPSRRAAGITPTAEKAAAGALAHLPVVRLSNLVRDLGRLRARHVWVVGLDGQGPQAIGACRLLEEPVTLVVGAEGAGLARLTRQACDALVHVPMHGRVGSLNASVAAGIALYETVRRRGQAGPD